MKKQYVVSLKNTNPRLNQTVRYLTNIIGGYPFKTTEINAAKVFSTKAAARAAIASISQDNCYHVETDIVLA